MHIIDIKKALERPLPGEKAQLKMAPPYRENFNIESILKKNPRYGGVLLLLEEKENGLEIVFTRRTEYDGVHSGQISFPGGKKEEQDADITATALRETEEEIGIKRTQLEVIGRLSELYIPPSNFLVYPSVAYSKTELVFSPQDREVKEIFSIPVSFFLQKENRKTTTIQFPNGGVDVPAYIYGERIIWGATAIILSEFAAIF